MKEIEKDWQVRVVLKIKSLSIQGLSGAPKMLRSIGSCEIQERGCISHSWGECEDWTSRWRSRSGKVLSLLSGGIIGL